MIIYFNYTYTFSVLTFSYLTYRLTRPRTSESVGPFSVLTFSFDPPTHSSWMSESVGPFSALTFSYLTYRLTRPKPSPPMPKAGSWIPI